MVDFLLEIHQLILIVSLVFAAGVACWIEQRTIRKLLKLPLDVPTLALACVLFVSALYVGYHGGFLLGFLSVGVFFGAVTEQSVEIVSQLSDWWIVSVIVLEWVGVFLCVFLTVGLAFQIVRVLSRSFPMTKQ